ncbi:xanthine dehydrogenase family protein molybdopterin-binding subunit [Paenibacillus sp. 2RAB27]|uniref:xanthine dehydrogenase family protein molybdopterin-binding subunit n=1 Tax=Paenibacillus sp. 2RAB27 TaxID=3232991 RepID=UPI003F9E0218
MEQERVYIGKSIPKKESLDKVTGNARYTGDLIQVGMLFCNLVISPYAHARILKIDLSKAWNIHGVRAILTGAYCDVLTGEDLRDKPIIAIDKVRYHGEIIAAVVADSEEIATRASSFIQVTYDQLPVINSPLAAIEKNSPLIHEHLDKYEHTNNANPQSGTNIANISKVRKGNIEIGRHESEFVVKQTVAFAPSDHAAMETRCALAEIKKDGTVVIETSSQAPFAVKKYMALYFGLEPSRIIVNTPLVGGGFGGKASIQLELIAYLASKAVGGRKVKIQNQREADLITSPVHIGLEAEVKLGATKEGKLKFAEITYYFDGGAYSDKAIDVVNAAVIDCSGPYSIEHVHCDGLCIYTNHPYASAYRGYGHSELTFAMERAMDCLSEKLQMDPLELRLKNAISPGDTSPTQQQLTNSNLGDLPGCIHKLREIISWDTWRIKKIDPYTIRSKGISCFWKNSSIDVNAGSGAVIMFNPDGSINLICGVVEIGTGTKTVLTQILAEQMKMDVNQIHVKMEVDTSSTPEHWKTVASRGTLMAGWAVIDAAADAIYQLKVIAEQVLRVRAQDLEVSGGRVFYVPNPLIQIEIKDICYGYTYPNGNTIGGQIIGRGTYTQKLMTYIDSETGEGRPGPEWSVGAQSVEVEFNSRDCTYKIVKAVSVLDAGKVLNQKGAEGQIMGAMNMGLGFANRETFIFDQNALVLNPTLRDYNLMRYGENPEYEVVFVETPCLEAPYGARGLGEQGLIGMPAALADALSRAAGTALTRLPLFPEYIWKTRGKTQYDSI